MLNLQGDATVSFYTETITSPNYPTDGSGDGGPNRVTSFIKTFDDSPVTSQSDEANSVAGQTMYLQIVRTTKAAIVAYNTANGISDPTDQLSNYE
jgi:hypothetical protein